MHMHMYHEYESVYEYGSNAFELFLQQNSLILEDASECYKKKVVMGFFVCYSWNHPFHLKCIIVWARSAALCGGFWKKWFFANLCHFFVRKSHFLPKTAAKCQKWIFFQSPTQRSRTCSCCSFCEVALESQHFKDTKTHYNFFLSHSEAVSKIKLFSCRPSETIKATQKMMIKEP